MKHRKFSFLNTSTAYSSKSPQTHTDFQKTSEYNSIPVHFTAFIKVV